MTAQNPRRTGWPLAVVLSVVLCAGCAGKVDRRQLVAGYDPLATDGARYAIGGFVAGEGVEPDDPTWRADNAAESDAWSPLLYGAMLAGRRDLVVWSWPAVRDNVPADGPAAVQAALAVDEEPPAAALQMLAGDLPEITYLVLGRLDENRVETGDMDPPGALRDDVREDRDVQLLPNSLQRTGKVRRKVTVTLVVYDLAAGRAVWRGTVSRDRTDLLSPRSVEQREDVVVTPAQGEGDLPEIRLKGASIVAPDLEGLLADACRALVSDLFAAPK